MFILSESLFKIYTRYRISINGISEFNFFVLLIGVDSYIYFWCCFKKRRGNKMENAGHHLVPKFPCFLINIFPIKGVKKI
jgi:hypothetical protein